MRTKKSIIDVNKLGKKLAKNVDNKIDLIDKINSRKWQLILAGLGAAAAAGVIGIAIAILKSKSKYEENFEWIPLAQSNEPISEEITAMGNNPFVENVINKIKDLSDEKLIRLIKSDPESVYGLSALTIYNSRHTKGGNLSVNNIKMQKMQKMAKKLIKNIPPGKNAEKNMIKKANTKKWKKILAGIGVGSVVTLLSLGAMLLKSKDRGGILPNRVPESIPYVHEPTAPPHHIEVPENQPNIIETPDFSVEIV